VATLKYVQSAKDRAKLFKTFRWGVLVCRCSSLVENATAEAKYLPNNVEAAVVRD